jgi:hypothetical protein
MLFVAVLRHLNSCLHAANVSPSFLLDAHIMMLCKRNGNVEDCNNFLLPLLRRVLRVRSPIEPCDRGADREWRSCVDCFTVADLCSDGIADAGRNACSHHCVGSVLLCFITSSAVCSKDLLLLLCQQPVGQRLWMMLLTYVAGRPFSKHPGRVKIHLCSTASESAPAKLASWVSALRHLHRC